MMLPQTIYIYTFVMFGNLSIKRRDAQDLFTDRYSEWIKMCICAMYYLHLSSCKWLLMVLSLPLQVVLVI